MGSRRHEFIGLLYDHGQVTHPAQTSGEVRNSFLEGHVLCSADC